MGLGLRVLFVEDNRDVQELVQMLLEDEGLDVVACSSAEQAQAEFGRQAFDVVMTDVSLPSMSGTELAKRLLRTRPDLWVVFASGYPMAGGLGAWGPRVRSLLKPFEADELHTLVEEIRASLSPSPDAP